MLVALILGSATAAIMGAACLNGKNYEQKQQPPGQIINNNYGTINDYTSINSNNVQKSNTTIYKSQKENNNVANIKNVAEETFIKEELDREALKEDIKEVFRQQNELDRAEKIKKVLSKYN